MREVYSDRLPSFSQIAEQGLLGLLLWTNSALDHVADALLPADFYLETHQAIYEAITRLHEKHASFDPIPVSEIVERKGFETIDGKSTYFYLLGLMNREMEMLNFDPIQLRAETYAAAISQHAEWRRLGQAAWQIMQLAKEGVEDATEQAEALVMSVRKQHRRQDFTLIGDYYPQYLQRLEDLQAGKDKVRGIPSGFPDLDRVLGGLQRGSLYVPAARPRVGKTTLSQNFAYNAALKYGKRVAFFSLEMSMDDLMDRFVAIHTKIDSQKLRIGEVSDSAWSLLVDEVQSTFEQLGIWINHVPGMTIDTLKSTARRLVTQYSIDLVIVDYLQLLSATINGKRLTPRAEEVAEIARQLKALAGELNVPVVAPAQINREIERRAGSIVEGGEDLTFKIPMLSDLRESGEIENSADVVMFLARSEEREERVKLVVAKHRTGPEGELDLYFVGSETRFYPVVKE